MNDEPEGESDIPMREEFEMACEDFEGKPYPGLSGKPDAAERVAALERRIDYLTEQIELCCDRIAEGNPDGERLLCEAKRDLREARVQLEGWRIQRQGRN